MLLLLCAGGWAEPLEMRALAGALVETQSHGELDVGIRAGPWSAELYTDTLSLKWAPELSEGRAWVELRGAAFAAGLMITPWFGGEPAPGMALTASYAGLDAGAVHYLPAGFWAGGGAGVKLLAFGERDTTVVPVPGMHLVGGPMLTAGWWSRPAQVAVRGGVELVHSLAPSPTDAAWGELGPVGDDVGAWVEGDARWAPRWRVAPRAELRAGWATARGPATAFRLGGSMPYQVPITGYGWSRFWVESYVAARLGLRVGSPDAAPGSGVGAESVSVPTDRRLRLRGGVLADAAAFDAIPGLPGCPPEAWEGCDLRLTTDGGALGLGVELGARYQAGWAQLEAGYGVNGGQGGLDDFTLMFRFGLDWVPLRRAEPRVN